MSNFSDEQPNNFNAMGVDSTKGCQDTFSSYLGKVLDYQSSEGIDPTESQDLFTRADQCGPEATGNDAIQFTYQQISGIPNLGDNPYDSRPIVPGVLVTRYVEEDPIFQQSGFFAQYGKNACFSFDVQAPRELVCKEQKPEIAKMKPIDWKDDNFHRTTIELAKTKVEETGGKNWRILKDQLDTDTALEVVRQNSNLPHIVAHGIQQGIARISNPWEVLDYAYTLLEDWSKSQLIDADLKQSYGVLLSQIVRDRLGKVADQVYRESFVQNFDRSYESYLERIRKKEEIASSWRSDYFNKGWGAAHGIVLTIGGAFAIPLTIKWVASLVTVTVAAPTLGVAAAIFTVAGVVSLVAVYYKSRQVAKTEAELNLTRKIDRNYPPRP